LFLAVYGDIFSGTIPDRDCPMPRQKRADEAGVIYHAINRGNLRAELFHKPEDYFAFIRVRAEGLEKYSVELFASTLMPNHWHLVLRPAEDGQMGRLLRWATATHSLRIHAHYHTRGQGHLYQSRFKSFPVQDDSHFYTVCRYVERNPLRAGLVDHSEDWQYGSLFLWNQLCEPTPQVLSAWPVPRLPNWIARVNDPVSENELAAMRRCSLRGSPFGSTEWIEETAAQTGTWSTLRPIGRPQVRPKPPTEADQPKNNPRPL